MLLFVFIFFFFKQKTAYEMRISDWSSDVCSSDLILSSVGTTRTSRGAGALVYGEASALARGDEGGQRQRYSADPQPRRHAALDLGDGARAADDARARVADARRYACAADDSRLHRQGDDGARAGILARQHEIVAALSRSRERAGRRRTARARAGSTLPGPAMAREPGVRLDPPERFPVRRPTVSRGPGDTGGCPLAARP